jgi:uncharacterized membrane protein YczE
MLDLKGYIQRYTRLLQLSWIYSYSLLLVIAVFFEIFFPSFKGMIKHSDETIYVINSLCIILTLMVIPLSLSLYNKRALKVIPNKKLIKAIKLHVKWNFIRLAILMIPAWFNLSMYYFSQDDTGLWAMGVILIATSFCYPTRKKIEYELNINDYE